MVATLVKLKWRLTLNALTKNVWAIIGTVFGALYGLGALGLMLAGAVGLGLKADPDVIMLVLGSLGALLVVGWAVVPLLVTGVDSTLLHHGCRLPHSSPHLAAGGPAPGCAPGAAVRPGGPGHLRPAVPDHRDGRRHLLLSPGA